jgi:mono/diheme cytochrome c family protein
MNVIVRRAGLVIGSLCLLLILVAAGGYVASQQRITQKYAIATESIPIPTDSLSIASGRHHARAMQKCADCHGPTLAGGENRERRSVVAGGGESHADGTQGVRRGGVLHGAADGCSARRDEDQPGDAVGVDARDDE